MNSRMHDTTQGEPPASWANVQPHLRQDNYMLERLGKYIILGKLGEGPLGAVYQAQDAVRSLPAAIRILPESFAADPALEAAIYRACRAVAAIQHPNIAGIQGVAEEKSRLYIVTEWLAGQSLRALLDDKTEISLENKVAIMIHVAEGLDYAHRNGIVHRGLRPSNIHLTPEGIIKIRDFGFSVSPEPEHAHPGTPVYLAPELILGEEGGERADIFSAGVVFYELLTSVHPFHSRQGPNALQGGLHDSEISTVEAFPDLPLGFWPILQTCLQKNPSDRYANMGEVLAAFRELFEDLVEGSGLMRKELQGAMPLLKQAAEKRGAGIKIAKLARDVERALADETLDHGSLQALTLSLADHYPLLRSAGESTPGRGVGPLVVPVVLPLKVHARPATNRGSGTGVAERPVVPSFPSESVLETPPMIERFDGAPGGAAPAETGEPRDTASAPENPEDTGDVHGRPLRQLPDSSRKPDNGFAETVKTDSSAAEAARPEPRIENPGRDHTKTAGTLWESPETVPAEPKRRWTDRVHQARETAKKHGWLKPRILFGGAAAALLVLLVLGSWPRNSSIPRSVHQSALGAARLSLKQKLFDDAIAMCETILAQSPDNEQARAILLQAVNGKRELRIDFLLNEAQTLRSEGRTDEAKARLGNILAVDPACRPARDLLNQLMGLPAQKDRDREVGKWRARVSALIQSGKLARAKAEIDKGEKLFPGRPEILEMRKEWAAKNAEMPPQSQGAAVQGNAGKTDETFARRVDDLYRRGNYSEAQRVLDQWTAENPKSRQAQALRYRTAEAQRVLKLYETALGEKRNDDALAEVAKLEKINPADPNLTELRARVGSGKASGKALVTVYRLGQPAVVTLDGQPIASNGEVENQSIATGKHAVAVKDSGGKLLASQNHEFLDGQSVVFVYDSASLQLREMRTADRDLLNRRKMEEGAHRFPVEHRHAWPRGKCEGDLILSYSDVEYRPKSGSHGFRIPFRSLKLGVDKGKIDVRYAADNQELRTFESPDSKLAEAVRQAWSKLESIKK